MSLLLRLVFRSVCRTTHERLAVDALRLLRGPDAERWSDLLLAHHLEYLAGAEAPDVRWCDFGNHVLHVHDGYWGGAGREAGRWYDRLVDAARRRDWPEAAFAAGAVSHYFADPFFPLNTARNEESTKIQALLEWSVCRSYGRLQQIIEHDQGGYPHLETPQRDDWLVRMIQTGAELAHEHFDAVIEHYDFERALRDPLAGMDQECHDRIARCLGHAVVGCARTFERALAQSEVDPPQVETTLQGFVALVAAPLRSACRQFGDMSERMLLEAMQDEAARTGKVVKNLRPEQREVRRLHAEEVLRIALHQLDQQPAKLTGMLYGSGCPERYRPNRLIDTPLLRNDGDVSSAWREAQRRVQHRTSVWPVGAAR
jgi:hypothetical protein